MKLLLPGAVFILMVSVGMSLQFGQVVAHWRGRSWQSWVRLLLATFIVPASVALVLGRIFPLPLRQTGGLFLVGATPGAPLLTRNLARRGYDMHLAASYQVWGAVLTPIMLPLMTFIGGKFYDRTIWIPPRMVAWQILEKEFVPLLVGMLLVRYAPKFSAMAQPTVNRIGNSLLIIVLVLMLWKMGPELRKVTPWVLLAVAVLLISSIAAMHLLVKASPVVVRTFAVSNANRHVGLALLISGRFMRAQEALPVISCYALAVALLMVVAPRILRPQELAKQAGA
jgi:bile acid:Na+ symporter, BASS family